MIGSKSALPARLRTGACLITLVVMAGCSASAAECQTASKCNELKGESVSQCTTAGDQCISQLQQANALCGYLATAIVDYNECASTLSCSDRELQNINQSDCTTQWGDMIGAAQNALPAGCPSCGTSFLSTDAPSTDGGS